MLPALLLAARLPCGAASAQAVPDLHHQDSWTEEDKRDFLKFLGSGSQAPEGGLVKEVAGPEEPVVIYKPRYLTFEAVSDTLFTIDSANRTQAESTRLGLRGLVGGHLWSWVRYFGGLQYAPLDQTKKDGTTASLSHFMVPLGLEFALIPLGTPQTRYVTLRAGIAAHYFSGSAQDSDFNASLLGWRASWNMGLGYEWQIPDSGWRVHAGLDGYTSIARSDGAGFYGFGANLGIVGTF